MYKNFLLIILFFIITACSIGYVINIKEPTSFPEGRDLYVAKCSSCHQLYNPNLYTNAKWDNIMISMKEKAKLSSEQNYEIYNWIKEQKEKNVEKEMK